MRRERSPERSPLHRGWGRVDRGRVDRSRRGHRVGRAAPTARPGHPVGGRVGRPGRGRRSARAARRARSAGERLHHVVVMERADNVRTRSSSVVVGTARRRGARSARADVRVVDHRRRRRQRGRQGGDRRLSRRRRRSRSLRGTRSSPSKRCSGASRGVLTASAARWQAWPRRVTACSTLQKSSVRPRTPL